jgi:hypothetical protein
MVMILPVLKERVNPDSAQNSRSISIMAGVRIRKSL